LYETSGATKAEIVELLRPFSSRPALEATVEKLIQHGLVEEDETGFGSVHLTVRGRDLHARALHVQQIVRRQAVEGITEADYVTTARVLQQIVENCLSQAFRGTKPVSVCFHGVPEMIRCIKREIPPERFRPTSAMGTPAWSTPRPSCATRF